MIPLIKKILFAIILCLSILHIDTGPAYALEEYRFTFMSPPLLPVPLEVTSRYGPRKLNGHDFHEGIDFHAVAGQEVHAVADGIIDVAYWSDNDGGIVFIEHEKNWYSVYIDLGGTFPHLVGEEVKAGEVIGYVGNANYIPGATGSHLHFEVRILDPNTDGILPWIYAPYAPWLPEDCVSDALVKQNGVTWDASFDFTGKIKEAIDKIAEACTKALDLLKDIIMYTIIILMTIDLSISFMFSSLKSGNKGLHEGGVFLILATKAFTYALMFWIIMNWSGFIGNGVRDFFMSMGATASGYELTSAKTVVADPFSIVARGAKIVEPLFLCFNDASTGFTLDFNRVLSLTIFPFFFFVIILGCFIIIAIMISISYLEFYLVVVFSFSTFMFAGWAKTRRFAANGMSAIFTSAVKLMVVTFYACLMTAIINTMAIDNLVTEEDATVEKLSAHADGNFKNLQEFMAAIKMVETSGNPEAYITPSMDGWGYGAYQISYENWDSWCENAGITDIPPMPWPEGSSAWYTSYGDRSIPYTGDWHDVLPPAPTPWPPSVQDAVATHKMGEYYAHYGSWEKVAYAWNGGPGAADEPFPKVREYWQKVCNASGSLKKRMHTLNYSVVLLLATYCVFFLFIGDRVLTMITKYLGGGGWQFTTRDNE